MKTVLQKLMILFLIVSGISAMAQQTTFPEAPYKSMEAPGYATDILIQGNASEDQRYTKIVVAPNGMLYAAYLISTGGYRVARSTDNGITWIYSPTLGSGYYLNAVDIAVTGIDTNSMNVWAISTGFMKASIDIWDVTVEKLDAQMHLLTSIPIDQVFANYGFPDVAIATDFAFPSAGASPFSIGVIYSKTGSVNDNVIFKSSGNGGSSFTTSQTLASTGKSIINVALAFGRSPAYPQGRYVAAWDKQLFFGGGYFGQVLTAHTLSQFNGQWSATYRLDTIAGGLANSAKDPSIACQADLVNNASGAFSVVVMYDKMVNSSGSSTCVYGAGNLNPIAGAPWTNVFSSGTGNIRDIEPDVTYDLSHQKFYVAWSDSLNAKLKCSETGMNLQGGGAWTSFSDGFNDAANIANPFPKVKVNPVSQQVVHVWDGERSSMVANATFDKSDLPVGIADASKPEKFSFSASPNPCQFQTSLSFNIDREVVVSASIFDLSGRQVLTMPSQTFSAGNHKVVINTSTLTPACYIVQLHAGSAVGFQRIIVIP